MTWIVDENGRRWVDPKPRKQRKPARALRFAHLKVGDQIMQAVESFSSKPDPVDPGEYIKVPYMKGTSYYVVTDFWFDPVLGQDDPVKGQMVCMVHIMQDGSLSKRKSATTIRGLASQGYHYADRDRIAECRVRAEAMTGGDVVGIGMAHAIRKRPRIAGL